MGADDHWGFWRTNGGFTDGLLVATPFHGSSTSRGMDLMEQRCFTLLRPLWTLADMCCSLARSPQDMAIQLAHRRGRSDYASPSAEAQQNRIYPQNTMDLDALQTAAFSWSHSKLAFSSKAVGKQPLRQHSVKDHSSSVHDAPYEDVVQYDEDEFDSLYEPTKRTDNNPGQPTSIFK